MKNGIGRPTEYDRIKYEKGVMVKLNCEQIPTLKDEQEAKFYYIADHSNGYKLLLATNAFPEFSKTWPMDMVPKYAENMDFNIIKKHNLTTCWWVDKKEFDQIYKEQHKK
jgi:hypothetical protein